MRFSTPTARRLAEKYKEISLLGKINGVLGWDMNVNLPVKAANARAQQVSYLTAISTDKWLDVEFRRLIEKSQNSLKSLTDEEKAMVRNLDWAGQFYWKVPKALVVEFSQVTSEAFMAWQKAKVENDFPAFSEYLTKILRMNRIIADHLGYTENRYDALLNLYEQNLTVKKLDKVFGTLKKELVPFLKKLTPRNPSKSPENPISRFIGPDFFYSEKRQAQLANFIIRRMGYDLQSGRLDVSAHPFTTGLARNDVRITTKYLPHDFRSSFTAAIHETGHALYDQGYKVDYEDTPLEGGISLGIHESQSRFWENQVGRSEAFLTFLTPILQAFYPEYLSNVSSQEVYTLFNHVEPGLIRIEADEVTYNFHIMLRYELEEKLINEKLEVKDLSEVWRTKMKEYLGVVPKTDREGVLQDVHWSYGNFGYFPTYTLGNLYAAQFTNTMKKELNISELTSQGEFGTILSWLRDNVHVHGSSIWPNELVKKVTGEELDPKYFVNYIKEKYGRS